MKKKKKNSISELTITYTEGNDNKYIICDNSNVYILQAKMKSKIFVNFFGYVNDIISI